MSQCPLKVTVFGASTGSLGRSVVYELASHGVTCMIPYRGEGDEVRHLKQSGDVGKVNPIPFHPRDEQSIRDCIGNSDIVLNLVGKYYETKNLYLKKNYTYQDVNIYFPERLARICNDMGVKHFLHVSALQQNLKHRSEWARTKAKGEEVVRATKPETCIVRPADMFGEDDRVLQWIGRQFHIYPWLININGGAALKQPVWYGDVAMAIRKYCAAPETFDGKTMELAGPEVMAWSQLVEWFREVTETKRVPPRTPTAIARMYAGLLEFGPKPYISRSEVDLRVTDNVLDPHTTCLTFKDLGITPHTIEEKGFSAIMRYRKGGHWAYKSNNADIRVI